MACMYKEDSDCMRRAMRCQEQMVPEAESSLLVTSEPYVRSDDKVALPQPDSEDEDEEDAYDLSSEEPSNERSGQLPGFMASFEASRTAEGSVKSLLMMTARPCLPKSPVSANVPRAAGLYTTKIKVLLVSFKRFLNDFDDRTG